MPVASSLQKMLGAPALLLPMGQVREGGRQAGREETGGGQSAEHCGSERWCQQEL